MSNIKESFAEKFYKGGRPDAIQDSMILLNGKKLNAWLDIRAEMEDIATNRIIELEDEVEKLKKELKKERTV